MNFLKKIIFVIVFNKCYCTSDLTELEKVIVLPFVGRADEIELSGIPQR